MPTLADLPDIELRDRVRYFTPSEAFARVPLYRHATIAPTVAKRLPWVQNRDSECRALHDFYRHHGKRAAAVHAATSQKALLEALGITSLADAPSRTQSAFEDWKLWHKRLRTVAKLQRSIPFDDSGHEDSDDSWRSLADDIEAAARECGDSATAEGVAELLGKHPGVGEAVDVLDDACDTLLHTIQFHVRYAERWMIMVADQREAAHVS